MALRFNGTDGFLEHAAAICTAAGYTMAVMVATDKSGPNSEQVCVSQGSSTNDAFMTVGFGGSSENKYATDRADGVGSLTSQKSTSPNISSSGFGWLIGAFTSNTSRSVAFGSSAFSTPDTSNSSQNYSHLNRVVIGATRRSAGVLQHAKADLAEVHFFTGILTSGQIDALVAGSVLPEDTSGWVDGWTLQTFSSGGTYTSIGGSRTLTASGGVTASPLGHPITRSSAPTLTDGFTLGDFVLSGAFATGALSQLSGGITLDNLAMSGFMGLAPGRVDTAPFKNWSGTLLPGVTVANVVFLKLDRTTALALTNQTTAGDAVMTVQNAALTPGTSYVMVSYSADGTAIGAELVLAT